MTRNLYAGLFSLILVLSSNCASAEGRSVGIQYADKSKYGIYFASQESTTYGWYFDFLFSIPRVKESSVYDFNSNYTENVLNDEFRGSKKDAFSFSLGRTMELYQQLQGYAALGLGFESKYREYSDQYGILGDGGQYYIKDGNSTNVNGHIGLLLFLEKVSLKLGYESHSSGATFGIGADF